VKLKAWLRREKMTQAGFAKLIGSVQSHISELASGKAHPMLEMVWRIKKATNGAVDYPDWRMKR
jgi:transcriptional regulator with XRE-family HTH domain